MEAVASKIEGDAAPRTASILLVAPPARGGIARHVMSLMSGLDRDGYHVGVACEGEGPVADMARAREIPLFEVPISPGGGPPRAAVAAVKVARAIADMRAQIVHTHSFGAGLIGALAMPIGSASRLVATIHNYPPDAEGMRARRRRDRWALNLVCGKAARLIAVSEALRSDLLAVKPEVARKTKTIMNGIDLRAAPARGPSESRRALAIAEGAPLVGMVARLAPQKGIEDFIRAARLVADAIPSAQFVLAGDGPLREEAAALAREPGMKECLHLLGEVEGARDLIAALDVLVVASTSEGSSVVAMEAMSLGKAVVATAVGGVPEVVLDGETGIVVEPRRPEALAEGITSLLKEPERAQAMGERGRWRAEGHFDVRQMVESIEAIYADLVREQIEDGGARE